MKAITVKGIKFTIVPHDDFPNSTAGCEGCSIERIFGPNDVFDCPLNSMRTPGQAMDCYGAILLDDEDFLKARMRGDL